VRVELCFIMVVVSILLVVQRLQDVIHK
jgi:hypothetical protein